MSRELGSIQNRILQHLSKHNNTIANHIVVGVYYPERFNEWVKVRPTNSQYKSVMRALLKLEEAGSWS